MLGFPVLMANMTTFAAYTVSTQVFDNVAGEIIAGNPTVFQCTVDLTVSDPDEALITSGSSGHVSLLALTFTTASVERSVNFRPV